MITCNGIASGGSVARGMRKDKRQKSLIVQRQQKRKSIEEIEDFIAVMKKACPEMFDIGSK